MNRLLWMLSLMAHLDWLAVRKWMWFFHVVIYSSSIFFFLISVYHRTDKSIKIWDTRMLGDDVDLSWKQWSEDEGYVVPGKACINTIEAHSGGVFCVQFDHIKILSGSSDRSAKVISFR